MELLVGNDHPTSKSMRAGTDLDADEVPNDYAGSADISQPFQLDTNLENTIVRIEAPTQESRVKGMSSWCSRKRGRKDQANERIVEAIRMMALIV